MSPLSALDRAPVWLNSEPLTADGLRGRVVLVDFWTYSCINWLRTLPYVRAWHERYGERGLVVVGAHAPEFGFEHHLGNVRHATGELGVGYPVVIDNDFSIWRAFENHYWPAVYLLDGDGRVQFHHFGEEAYEETERAIQRLLGVDGEPVRVDAGGLAEAADWDALRSPETYVGYARGERRRRRTRARSTTGRSRATGRSGGGRRPRGGRRLDRLPLPGARSQPGPHAGGGGRAGALRRAPRRSAAGRRPRPRRRRVRRGHRLRAADVPARAPARRRRQRTFEITFHDPGVRAYVFTFG